MSFNPLDPGIYGFNCLMIDWSILLFTGLEDTQNSNAYQAETLYIVKIYRVDRFTFNQFSVGWGGLGAMRPGRLVIFGLVLCLRTALLSDVIRWEVSAFVIDCARSALHIVVTVMEILPGYAGTGCAGALFDARLCQWGNGYEGTAMGT